MPSSAPAVHCAACAYWVHVLPLLTALVSEGISLKGALTECTQRESAREDVHPTHN